MKIGFDIDGVLANFTDPFSELLITTSGRDLFGPERPFVIPCWAWPSFYGYTEPEVKAAFNEVWRSKSFWASQPCYPDTVSVLNTLQDRVLGHGDEVYFVTTRSGDLVKLQTELWLNAHGMQFPTVILSSDKGAVVNVLDIDAIIEDNVDNITSIALRTNARTYLLTRSWNEGADLHVHTTRVNTVAEFLAKELR